MNNAQHLPVVAFGLLIITAFASSAQLYDDVTASTTGLPPHSLLSLIDVDSDGDQELLVGTSSGTRLWKRTGAFSFEDITSVSGLDGVNVVAVADFDNDGFDDILHISQDRSDVAVYDNLQNGTFNKVPLGAVEKNALALFQENVTVADIDQDGDLDLVFGIAQSSGGAIAAVLNGGRYIYPDFPQPFSGVSILVQTAWASNRVSLTDANGDGRADLLVTRSNGSWPNDTHQNHSGTLYLNTGTQVSDYINPDGSRQTAGFLLKDDAGLLSSNEMSDFTSWDIDGDGDIDLINGSSDWASVSRPHIYVNDGAGNYQQLDSPIFQSDSYYHHAINVFDADLDNDLDAVWVHLHNFSDIYPRFWRNDGNLQFVDATTAWGVSARIPSNGNLGSSGYHADLDGDGDLDFVTQLWGAGDVYAVYRNNAVENSSTWLRVRLNGRKSPQAGIGARIEVTVGDKKLVQLVANSAGGIKNNVSPTFGLNGASKADLIRVYWPSGIVSELRDVVGNRTLAVTEEVMVEVRGGTLPPDSQLAGQTVNTFRIGKFEATLADWWEVKAFGAANGYDFPTAEWGPNIPGGLGARHPIQGLNWYDSLKFCNAKSEMEGLAPVYRTSGGAVYKSGQTVPEIDPTANGYRLPTEAEWEWAARGGVASQGYVYSGSNNADDVAWCIVNKTNPFINTRPVGTKSGNELGLHDMSGNAMEWCWRRDDGLYPLRGGNWGAPLDSILVTARGLGDPAVRGDDARTVRLVLPVAVPEDGDNDGVNDYREFQDGTDPNDPESFKPLSKGLVAYYPLNDNANDESGYGNDGMPQGVTPAADRFGNSAKACSFSGSAVAESNIKLSGDAVNITGGKTFSAWVKSEGGQENPRIFSTAGYEVGVNSGSRVFANQTDGSSVDTLESADSNISGRFAHVVAVWSDTGMSLYIDGLLTASKPWDGLSEADFSRAFAPEIGGNSGGESDPFGGVIDDVRVYNRALTETEVQQLYAVEAAGLDSDGDGVTDYRERRDGTNPLDSSSLNVLSKNLVAHYPFDGNTLDESGHANHAANRGAMVSADRFGEASGAYDFNGVDAYMDAPPLVSDYQRNFTMSGWIRTTHVSSDRLDAAVSALCKTRDAGDFGGPAIDFREGKAVFTFNNNRVYGDLIPFEEWEYATTDLLADGNWRHYIMSIDTDGLITAFINGQQVASHQISTFLEVTGASPFQIGRAGGAHEAGRYFPGQIDEVRIYNRGLTAEEATMLYSESVCGLDSDADGVTDYRERRDGTNPYDVASFEPLSVALIANYPFDNSWKDESGYCRDVLAPYTTFEPGLLGTSLGLAEGNSQASYWNDPNNTESPGRINNFTFSVWMKAATLDQPDGQAYYLVSAPNNAAYLRIANWAEGSRVLGLGYEWPSIPGYGYQTLGTSVLRTGVWQHVVGVQEGEATRIYVNGTLVGSTDTGELVPFDPENFTLGNLFNSNTFQGQLDEVRIYVRALSPAEVGALYVLEIGDLDSDNDGLDDVHETNTGTFVSATDTGSDPYDSDSSDDGLLDGEVVTAGFNPNTSYTPLFNLVKSKSTGDQARIGLFTESAMIDLNLGGIVLRKSGSTVNLRLQIQSKTDLKAPHWTDEGTETFILDMPGNKAFMRIRALGPQ